MCYNNMSVASCVFTSVFAFVSGRCALMSETGCIHVRDRCAYQLIVVIMQKIIIAYRHGYGRTRVVYILTSREYVSGYHLPVFAVGRG